MLTIVAAFAVIIGISYVGQYRREIKDMDIMVKQSVHLQQLLFNDYARLNELEQETGKCEQVIIFWQDGTITSYQK